MLLFVCIFQTKKEHFTVTKEGFALLWAICCSRLLLRLLRAHFSFFFFCLCPSLSSRVSRPAIAPANQEVSSPSSLPVCQFSPLLSGQQTVEERASLSKLMARALLPGLKMNRNVVYLKHTRPPPGRKITQHTNSRPRLWVIFLEGETCCSKTISLITLLLLFDLPPFCVCFLFFFFGLFYFG